MDSTPKPAPGGLAAELASAGFGDAREIGRGGCGVVYHCYQTSLARSVAVKVLVSDIDPDNRERFLREGYAMGALSGHPNIVQILQVGVTDSDRPYIVMPYYSVDSLAVRLRRSGPIQWPEAVRVGVKLCGALETAHRTSTLHRDIKPANVLVNDYGEPQLTDFGIAHIAGGYETATGFFSGTIAYTAPEVLAGRPATVAADVYSLGATIYALIAGTAAHERNSGEDLIAHYLRISTTAKVPDMRPGGIPEDVCAAIERAMSREPENRQASAEEFGKELQATQRRNGLMQDSMALSLVAGENKPTAPTRMPQPGPAGQTRISEPTSIPSGGPGREPPTSVPPPGRSIPPPGRSGPPTGPSVPASAAGIPTSAIPTSAAGIPTSAIPTSGSSVPPPGRSGPPSGTWGPTRTSATSATGPPSDQGPPQTPAQGWVPPGPQAPAWSEPLKKGPNRTLMLVAAAGAVVALVAVVTTLYFVMRNGGSDKNSAQPPQPTTEVQAPWQPITNARTARDAVATTQADGTIWIFGGLGADGAVSARHEGYDPAIDNWKGGDDLPVTVQHAMAVTWQGNPVVLGGWTTSGPDKVATDQVWRVINGRWVELPRMSQPRAAAAAAVVGDRIIVAGGVGANGTLLNTTEIFDGTSWKVGPPLPSPRQMLAAASDGKLMYAVGGNNGTTDVATVEAYDPAADIWMPLPDLPEARSDLGVAIADGRLVAVGGESSGQVLKSVAALDLSTKTWTALPDMGTARHGMAVAAVGKSVFAIGGSTSVGDSQLTSSAEALKLAKRKVQPASEWRSLPDAQTARLMMAWTVLDGRIWVIGGLREGTTLNTVESYDPQTGTWRSEPSLPLPLHHATAATYRNEVVVLGGATDNIAQASNKVFALRGGSWVELPSLEHARAGAAAAVVGDMLVIIGGQNEKRLVPETEIFDGESWKQSTDLPTPREHLAAVSDGVYVYAIGGRFLSADKNSAAFEKFDPVSETWTPLVDMPTPRGSYGATYIDGRIVVVGGEEPTQVLDAVEMYDIGDGKWTKLAPLPTPRHGEVVATVGDTIYAIGGANRPSHEGGSAKIEALEFT